MKAKPGIKKTREIAFLDKEAGSEIQRRKKTFLTRKIQMIASSFVISKVGADADGGFYSRSFMKTNKFEK